MAGVWWMRLPCEPGRWDNRLPRATVYVCHTHRVHVRWWVHEEGLYLKNAKATKNVMPMPGWQYGLTSLHLHRARVYPLAGKRKRRPSQCGSMGPAVDCRRVPPRPLLVPLGPDVPLEVSFDVGPARSELAIDRDEACSCFHCGGVAQLEPGTHE